MSDPPLCELSATRLAEDIRTGSLRPVDVVDAYLNRIESENNSLNAYISVIEESAREAAREAETALDRGEAVGPLHGVPVALKDLRAMKAGVRHTFGSRLFADFEADRTAVIVDRLEAAGAIVLGKTNTSEFGHKGVTQNELVGATASPVDRSLNAGGSSGGSAAAVGAGMAALATGSDAGGSIRIPAACCGVFGMKPSFGLVPIDSRPNAFGAKRHHTAFGPLSRTVEDAALMLEVMAGPHPADPGSVPVDVDFRAAVDRPIDDVSIAYSPDLDVFAVDPAVRAVVEDALTGFEAAGATVEAVTVDHGLSMAELSEAVGATFTAAMAATATVLKESAGVDLTAQPDDVSDSLLAMIEQGRAVESTEIARTGIVRTELFDAVQSIFGPYDLLVTPTLARPGFGLHEELGPDEWGTVLTWPFNITGHPAASVPAGRTDAGAPVGLQVVGRRYADDTVLTASAALEGQRPWGDN
ncbi:amidase [Halohasta salina]|uniref:amidase n=1 Tax=Halohasta salina TaxID=2961621 RepID=UPI0020A23E05|nr:amidase family protein [Halohasta salina]